MLTGVQNRIRTPGVLIREGASRGVAPTVEVLSLGPKNPTRQPSDLLPYLKRFRSYFTAPVQTLEEMELKTLSIPLHEVDCITQTIVKVRNKTFYTHIRKGVNFHNRSTLTRYKPVG